MAKDAPQPDVTRWASLLTEQAKSLGLDPNERVPLALAQMHKESRGNPGVRNKKSNAIGLGQQIAFVGNKAFRPSSSPYVHPDGKNAGFAVSWDPQDQTRALLGIVEHHRKVNRANLLGAWWGYASGAKNVDRYLTDDPETPDVVRVHREQYLPHLVELADVYGEWYAGWVAKGAPSTRKTLDYKTPDGERSYVGELATHTDARKTWGSKELEEIQWRGKTYPLQTGAAGDHVLVKAARAARKHWKKGLVLTAAVGGGIWLWKKRKGTPTTRKSKPKRG